MADDEQAARPRVLVLGGGFAGVGAARALKKADVEVGTGGPARSRSVTVG